MQSLFPGILRWFQNSQLWLQQIFHGTLNLVKDL